MDAIALQEPGTVLEASELPLNPDGSVYHLAMHPDQLADRVFVVGDPGRVQRVSARFDAVEHRVSNREFVCHTGRLGDRSFSVLATGIGTDNIDIVLNELDALVNVDLTTRTVKRDHRSLRIVRMGTTGALQPGIAPGDLVVSAHGLGLDNVLHYYAYENSPAELRLWQALMAGLGWPDHLPTPYLAAADKDLLALYGRDHHTGITATAGGFYGPQGRNVRALAGVPDLNERLAEFEHEGLRVTNFEMETSALYGLSGILGHAACTVCTVVANRAEGTFLQDHHAAVEAMIDEVLDRSTI